MMFRVEITAAALAEIDQALEWLVQRSPAAAARWHAATREAIDTLKSHPHRCPLAPEAAFFEQEIRQLLHGRRRGVYRILFQIDDEGQTVYILHVVHSARDYLRPEQPTDEEAE